MIQAILILLMIFWKRIPVTGFQTLLLVCLLEIKTGVSVTGYYYGILLFFYLLFRYGWWKMLHAPVVQSG